MNQIKINSHILKINGAVEIPGALVSGHNYKITVEGAIPKMETSDNDNGTFDITYKLKPIKVELITETGETMKAKDSRSNSTLNRSQARAIWLEKNPNYITQKKDPGVKFLTQVRKQVSNLHLLSSYQSK